LLVLQPTVLGDFMGKAVALQQPTKFALMEGAANTSQNPLISYLAYGDVQHPIVGFDTLRSQCNSLGSTRIADLAAVSRINITLGSAASVTLKSICLADLSRSESELVAVNALYYVKIAFGIVDLVSLVALAALSFSLGPLSKLTRRILSRFGEKRSIFLLSLLIVVSSIFASGLGWFVREVGRRPWTVYGLLYPEELMTRVAIGPVVLIFALVFATVAVVGVYGIYVVSTRRLKFIELLKKGAGVE
jgi:cytochrome d ubiquinol oxidase subunit I